MKQLPSGTRYGSRWPIAAFNRLGGLARAAGLFPKISDSALFHGLEAGLGRADKSSAWVKEARSVRFNSFDQDAQLSLFGALAVRAQVRRCFKTTLEFDRILEAHPQIEHEEIRRPIFVIGWPRTGTTLLQRLLCLHRQARFLPVWEAYSVLPEERGRALDIAERRRRAERGLNFLRWLAPDLKAIHPMGLDDPDECYHLFRNYCAMPAGWDFAYLPGYWRWFESQSAVPAYELHKRQLQILQWYRRGGHWVLKSPQHLAGLPALMQVYPDARIICTHRDPEEAIASYCSLVAVAWGMTSETIDLDKVADYVLTTAANSQRIARATLPSIPENQIYHVEYRELTRDPLKTIASIYERFSYPHDDGLDGRLRSWLSANPPDRHGRHKYDLADFGLTADDVRRKLE
jgi:hypothetical protein